MAQISPANGIMLLCTWIICTAQLSCILWVQDQDGSFREEHPKVALCLQKGRGACIVPTNTQNSPFHCLRKKKYYFLTCSNYHLLMWINSKTRENLTSILNIQEVDWEFSVVLAPNSCLHLLNNYCCWWNNGQEINCTHPISTSVNKLI